MGKITKISSGLLTILLLSGCLATEEYAVPPPPAPRYEVIGVAPYPDYVWVGGNWEWERRHRRYNWRNGYWRRRY